MRALHSDEASDVGSLSVGGVYRQQRDRRCWTVILSSELPLDIHHADGERDGTPEPFAARPGPGMPVIMASTRIGSISNTIEHGATGYAVRWFDGAMTKGKFDIFWMKCQP